MPTPPRPSQLSPATSPKPARLVLTRRGRRVALGGVALFVSAALVALLPAAVQSDQGLWSQPAALAPCSTPGAPAILFPSDTPRHGTGPGAIVWGSAFGCPGGAGPRVAMIAADDAPRPASLPRTLAGRALGLAGPVTVAGAPRGRILLAGPAGAGVRPSSGGPAGGLLLSEGVAGGPFTASWATGGAAAPLALATAYLGDVALLSPGGFHHGRSAIELRMHRYYAHSFLAPVPVGATPSHSVEGLTLAMDYRSDALAAWERAGAIYARDLPGSGRSARSVTRVAFAAPGARIAALRSDDNRAILAWTDTRAGVTSVYAELSAPGVRFGAPRLLERFTDPHGLAPPSGSLRMVRLLSESVMLAWTGVQAKHWVVRAAAVDLNGVRAIETISNPNRDALLADLAPGPAGEAYALWTEPRPAPAGLDSDDQALFAARGIDAYPGRTIFAAPEQITTPGASGSTGEAAIAVDPDSDRAIAAWRTSGGTIDYSLRAVGGA